MWAVYELEGDKTTVKKFIGYMPAFILDRYQEDADCWDVKLLVLPDGTNRVGRARGRGFFCSVNDLRADVTYVEKLMGFEGKPTPDPTE